jgi:hypothetical protein
MKLDQETKQKIIDQLLSTDIAAVRLGAYICLKQLNAKQRSKIILACKDAIIDRFFTYNCRKVGIFLVHKLPHTIKIYFKKGDYSLYVSKDIECLDIEFKAHQSFHKAIVWSHHKAITQFFKVLSNPKIEL